MPSVVSPIISGVEKHRKKLSKLTSVQLGSEKARGELRAIVEGYFKASRPLIEAAINEEHLSSLDGRMQELLAYCHRRGARKNYISLLASIKKDLIAIDSHLVAGISIENVENSNPTDRRIVETLLSLVPTASASYEQALRDLTQEDRISWRGPATDLRESLRETLDHLAPDNDVESQQGFKHIDSAKRPTMKQKVRYVLRSRGTSATLVEPAENATDAVEDTIGKLVRSVYNRSSVSTDTHSNKDEVLRVLEFVRVVLCELLEIRR